MTSTAWILSGSVSAFLSVALGAFGAHGLANRVEPRMLEIWQTAAHYQVVHALALVALGVWQASQPTIAATASASFAGWAFLAGSLLFSGSLYALVLSDVRVLGAITPLGGVAFLLGWGALAWTAYRAGASG